MRIAFFTDTYEPQKNGVVTSINLFKEELERQGHKVLIFCPRSKELAGRKDVVQFRSVPFKPYPEYRLAMPSPAVVTKLRRFGPDVVHVHSPGPIGLSAISAAKLLRIPVVFTYHTDLYEYQDYVPFKAFKSVGIRILEKVLRFFIRRADVVIFPGKEIMRKFNRQVAKVESIILPTGTVGGTCPHANGTENYVLQVGRLCKERRVDVLLKAFKKLNKPGLKLCITSEGPEKERLVELAKKLGISERVRFLGYVNEKEKRDLYRHAKLFVTPSPTDTQGLVALEAMQYGAPVIAARAGGFLDYIRDGKNGLHFRPNDHRNLARKMKHLLRDDELRKRLSRNGYETVKQFDMKIMVRRLVSIYKGDKGYAQRKTVTVVVPARNEEKHIGACLKALRAQTIRPEIIVVDGHSTDRTRKIAAKYADRIVLDRKRGLSDARNVGWKAARHDVVAFCDADSVPPENWTEQILRNIGGNAAVSGPIIPYDGGRRMKMEMKVWADVGPRLAAKLGYNSIWGANMAFKREILEKYPFELRFLEDWWMGRRLREAKEKIRFTKAVTLPVSSRRFKESGFHRGILRFYLMNYAKIKLRGVDKDYRGYY